ncbi:MgtC/SapB family protein [Nitrosophilus labii]|uniref:MgtC/SapB family protein n=1 Tax=Nitrosophilus labii TaxID=2706014 RepID=UPI00165747E5|nr:MgtC/SapB family protein [Nitrosophilus labii]
MDLDFAGGLAIAIILGFMIGLQREIQVYFEKSQEFGGARTFAIISLIGYLCAYLTTYTEWILPSVILGLIIFLTYVHSKTVVLTKDIGTTTEFAAIATFLVGALLFFKDKQSAIYSAILILFLLGLKSKIKEVEGKITRKDLSLAILFFLMTFVILPVLPKKAVDPFGIFNPYQIWLMVVLISGLSFLGYISVKFIGVKKGLLATGFFGGLVSSTAVALSLSKKAVANKDLSLYLAVTIGVASSTMFFRVIIEVAIVDKNLLKFVFYPFLAATLSGYIYLYLLYKKSSFKLSSAEVEFKNPLELKEAIKVGLAFGIIFGSISIVEKYFGNAGVYVISILSGLTDVDAITLSIANMSAKGEFSLKSASIAIVLASVSNSLSKMLIVIYLGGKVIGKYIAGFFTVSLLSMAAVLFLLIL